MVQAYQDVHSTVLNRFGGSICGEHGDGRSGPSSFNACSGRNSTAFCAGQESVRSGNILNPGIKLSDASFTDHIDYTRL